jgi:lipopolysaccharide/colanic/teichoic acid biosynthesis glycosyltransferase
MDSPQSRRLVPNPGPEQKPVDRERPTESRIQRRRAESESRLPSSTGTEMVFRKSRKRSPILGDRLQKVKRSEELLPSEAFLRALAREAGRSERSGEPFSLIRIESRGATASDFETLHQFCRARLRITDDAGWLDSKTVGILLPGASHSEAQTVALALYNSLGADVSSRFDCRIFSDRQDGEEDQVLPKEAGDWIGESDSLASLFVIPIPFFKRTCDIVGGTLLGLFALPVLCFSVLLIRLESRGTAIFRQTRVGHGGKQFTLLKLRTMVDDAEVRLSELQAENERDGPAFKHSNDPRVTRVGKLLRKTCIDELPQLWNVLKGDMTLVGPRPPLPNEVAAYEPWHRSRLRSKGGLTCLWQIHGKPRNVSFQDWVRMDIRYQSQSSPLRDLGLLAQTAWVVISSRGDT